MGPQEGGDYVHFVGLLQAPVDLELFELILLVQAVAALGFYRRDPQGQHLIQKAPGLLEELLLCSGAGFANRIQDAASGS